jgi:hypothetical protein
MTEKSHLKLLPANFTLNKDSSLCFIGSCFSDEIGNCVAKAYCANTLVNPFGTIYNPLSLAYILDLLSQKKVVNDSDVFARPDNLFGHFQLHSSFLKESGEDCKNSIAETLGKTNTFLQAENSTLFLTLGTATVYYHTPTQQFVGNCHKLPNKQFEKRRLSISQIETALSSSLERLFQTTKINNIVLTISPVRYIKDGLMENNLSKATLLLAVNALVAKFDNVSYFPSYELVIDELRDYSYSKPDLAHPNEKAVEYVWNKFQSYYFS